MSSLPYKRIKYNSNPKNKLNIIKNIKGMNDPAFKSNSTLKKYINQKLNSHLDPNTSHISKINNKHKNKIYLIKKRISFNNSLSENYIILNNVNFNNSSPKTNSSSYLFDTKLSKDNKKRLNKMVGKTKSNSLINLQNINKNRLLISQNQTIKAKKFPLYLIKNERYNLTEYNNNTPINVKKKQYKTSPINELNKKKTIFFKNQISLNESLGLDDKNKNFNNNLIEERENSFIINCKLNSISKNTKNSGQQIKLIKDEINNGSNINVMKLNKSYFREDSKISQNNNNKIINQNIIYSKHNKVVNKETKNLKNRVILLKDKISSLLQNDESLNESECPVPMPYVKRYSENNIIKNGNEENINLGNILFNKDLKEPKPRKNAPLPIWQPFPNYFIINKINNKKIFVFSNSHKINNLKIANTGK